MRNYLSRLYFSIWTDIILKFQERVPKSNFYWKFMTIFNVSFVMGINFMFVFGIVSMVFGLSMPKLNWFGNKIIETAMSSFIFFFLPWIVLNYFLIFWKEKYLIIITRHKYKNGKLSEKFIIIGIFTPIIITSVLIFVAKLF